MPVEIISLVETNISKIKPPSTGRKMYRDTAVTNFGLEVLAGGTMTFYRLGRVFGQVTKIKIGNYPLIRADLARGQCVKMNGEIAQGIDPRRKKRPVVVTLGDVWAWYYPNVVEGRYATAYKIKSTWDRVLSEWKDFKLSEIDRAMCVELQARLRTPKGVAKKGQRIDGPAAANSAIDLIRALYKTANHNSWFQGNPAAAVTKDRIRPRDRFIQPHEMHEFFKQLNMLTADMQDVFRLALFTGARRVNVCSARHEQVDLGQAVWTIAWDESKNRDAIRIPLIPIAAEIFARRSTNGSVWVFPSKSKSGHIVDPSTQWEKLLELSKLQDLRIHDLRRTIASWQAGAGTPLHVITKSLSQRSSQSTAVYAHVHDDIVRNAVQNAAELIIEAGIEKNPKEVVNRADDV